MSETENRLRKIEEMTGYKGSEIALIKNTVAKNTNDIELGYFLKYAQSIGLSPFHKEVWCYKDHQGNLLTFAGRDGFLKIAQRDPKWNGIYSCEVREGEEYEQCFNGEKIDFKHKKTSKTSKAKILGAFCFIKPKNCEIPTIEYVDFDTYNKGSFVWKSHPADMIKKVAEVKALKKAFGISGLQDENNYQVDNNKVYPINTQDTVDIHKISKAESLLRTASLTELEIDDIESWLSNPNLTHAKIEEILTYLVNNQLDPIESGNNYSQKEINLALDNKMADEKQ